MAIFKFNDREADVEFLKSSADIQRAVKYVTKEDTAPLVDNCDLDALKGNKHVKKYDTRHILETPIETLVDEGSISAGQYRNILWAQQDWKLRKKTPDKEDVRGVWIEGPSGCGKSTAAREYGLEMGGFYLKDQNKWWDGYDKEKVVILDDLDTGALCHLLKIWADKFAFKGEVKGGTIWLDYDTFIVTTNHTIPEIVGMSIRDGQPYPMVLEDAISRRFRIIDGTGDTFVTAKSIHDALKPPQQNE
nr:MAG: rep protein [Cressdnaviricota sp.]